MITSIEESEPSVDNIETVREGILDTLLIAITIVAIPPLVSSLYRSIDIGWQNKLFFYVVAYLLICLTTIFRRKIAFFQKSIIIISLCFLIGCVATIVIGLIGSGVVFMLFSIILATMFLGVRYGGILIVVGLVFLITVALGVNQGKILFDINIEASALALSSWISRICSFAFFTAILIFSLGRLITYLVDSSNILKERGLALKQANKTVLEKISEQQRAEEALRESEEKYRTLYENANDAICVAQDDMIKFPNPMAEKITGYTKEELVNIPLTDLIYPEDRAMVLDRHKRRLSGETITSSYSFRIVNKEGKVLWVHLNTVLIDWEGRPASLNFLADITQQKKLESQLAQAQKMESIGTMAGGIAHDFNNILSPIMIHTELAMMEIPSDDPIQNNLRNIYKAGERAKALVKQILTFARKRDEEIVPIKISPIVKEAIKFITSTIPSTIDIRYHIDVEGDDTVFADTTQMNQIVMNLCTNAAHAMEDEGGILEIKLSDEYIGSEEDQIYFDLAPGKYLRLSIKDTGTGIPPENLDKIFEPYFTTKDPGVGTGMGLAVVHGIVKNCGGAIAVESDVGEGTAFHVLLPVSDAEVSSTSEPEIELPKGNEHILIVDDEKEITDSFRSMLEILGYKVTARTSSIEALEAFRNKPEKFNLVITDMTMPNMTGKDLAIQMMAIRPDIPIILCTGFSGQINEKIAKKIGIKAFILKPIIMRDIAFTLRDVLDKS